MKIKHQTKQPYLIKRERRMYAIPCSLDIE